MPHSSSRRRGAGALFSIALSLALAIGSAAAGVPVPAQIADTGTLVATVVDRFGRPVVDLDADDFVIESQGQPRDVLSAHIADYPLVVLADRGRTAEEGEMIRSAVIGFLKRAGEERAVAVATLDAPQTQLVSFDTPRARALDALAAPWSPDSGAQPLPAVAHASSMLRTLDVPFGALVLVWSAEGTDSVIGESPDTLAALFDMRASLHVVARRANANDMQTGPEQFLRRLAERTSGRFTDIYTTGSYAAALAAAADRFAAEVMVQFLAGPEGRGGDLRVGVRIPGARVVGIRTY